MTFRENLSHSTLWLIALALITLVYSLRVVDFNVAKDGVLLLVVVLVSLYFLTSPRESIQVPYCILFGVAVVLVSATATLLLAPERSVLTLPSTIHYVLILLLLFQFINLAPADSRCIVTENYILLAATLVSLFAWIQYANITPSMFPAYPGFDQRIYSVFGNQNLLGGFIAFAIPILTYRISRSTAPELLPVIALILLSLTCLIAGSRSAWLAAAAGSLCTIPFRALRPRHAYVTAFIVVLSIGLTILYPAATVDRITNSFSENDVGYNVRVWIWYGTALMMRDHVIFGVGPGAFQFWSPVYLGEILNTGIGSGLHANQIHTLYPHSTPLDLVTEFGLGGLLLCGIWLHAVIRNRKSPVWGSAIAVTAFSLINSISVSTPHIIVAGLIYLSMQRQPSLIVTLKQRTTQRLPGLLLLLALFPIAILFAQFSLGPSYYLAQARLSYLETGDSPETHRQYQQAVQQTVVMPQARLEYALLLLEESPDGARLELTDTLEALDTGEAHLAMAYAYEQIGDFESARAHAIKGVHRWPRFYPGWVQLMRNTNVDARELELERASRFLNAYQNKSLSEISANRSQFEQEAR